MTKLEQHIQKTIKKKGLGLMTHLVVGYPSIPSTIALAKVMEKSGADIIELQIPFSDPIADGPTIMRACETSLERGTRVKDAFFVMKQVTQAVSIPVLFMSYYNTVFKYGVKKFCNDAAASGAAGLIVPDMPIEEEQEEHFMQSCRKAGLHHIHVISPDSTLSRIKKNAQVANGFVYCTARQGITGAREELDSSIKEYLQTIRKHIKVPLAVGFGISKKEHMVSLRNYADIAVVGSAIINKIAEAEPKNISAVVGKFVERLR